MPERLIVALEQRFLASESPRGITVTHVVGIGDEGEMGMNRLAHRSLIKRSVTSVYTDSPKLGELARIDAIESYLLPQGALSQLMREMAAGRPASSRTSASTPSSIPAMAAAARTRSTREEIVDLVQIDGKDFLRFKPFHIDVASFAARLPTKTATLPWSTRPFSVKCCRWHRRRAARAAS